MEFFADPEDTPLFFSDHNLHTFPSDLHAIHGMTTPAQRARIVSAAEAVLIIDECLFGPASTTKRIRTPFKRSRKRRSTSWAFPQPVAPCPLEEVELLPTPDPVQTDQLTDEVPADPTWRPSFHPWGFLPGLCYLAAVRECNVHEAVRVLGYYPTIFALRNSPLVEQQYIFLVLQRPGLFHVVTSWVQGASVPLSAPGHYVVGAQMPLAGPSNSNQRPPAGFPRPPNASWGRPMSPDEIRAQPPPRGPPAAPAFGPRGPPPPRGPLPPQNVSARDAMRLDPGPPQKKNRGKGKGRNKFVPFMPYSTDPQVRRPSSPTTKWRAAIQDPLDDAMNGFRATLDEYPALITKAAWGKLMARLNALKKSAGSDFDRKGCIPEMQSEFDTLLEEVQAAASALQEEERLKKQALADASNILASMAERYRALDREIAAPLPGANVASLEEERRSLGARISEQEALVDKMDGAEEPAETEHADGFSTVAPDVPPERLAVPKPSYRDLWPENNYQDHAVQTAPLFPTVAGKVPLDALRPVMRDQVDSKLYLPRSIELFTCDELAKVTPRGGTRWNNRYEDPLEPAKCWSWAEFEELYNRPGYHFMFS